MCDTKIIITPPDTEAQHSPLWSPNRLTHEIRTFIHVDTGVTFAWSGEMQNDGWSSYKTIVQPSYLCVQSGQARHRTAAPPSQLLMGR